MNAATARTRYTPSGSTPTARAKRIVRKVLDDLNEVEAWLGSSDADEKAYAREALPGLKQQREELVALLLDQLEPVIPYETATLWLRERDRLNVAAARGS